MMVRNVLRVALLLGIANCAAMSNDVQRQTEHFSVTLPETFGEPVVARMTNGVAYAFRAGKTADRGDPRFQIAVVRIPEWSAEAQSGTADGALDQCLAMFMTEVAREKSGFHIDPPSTGEIDSKPTRRVRWLGKDSGRQLTGILHCAREGNRFYVIHLQDTVDAAARSFPALKASIDTLRFTE